MELKLILDQKPQFTIDLTAFGGGINSIAVQNGIVAVAVENDDKQDEQLAEIRAELAEIKRLLQEKYEDG